MEPGQVSFVPVTQFAKYKEIEKGSDRARFFKHDLPSTASQTPGTVATVATMDIEAIDVLQVQSQVYSLKLIRMILKTILTM